MLLASVTNPVARLVGVQQWPNADSSVEGIDGERGIAWRLADSLALRRFVGISLEEKTPDHSTISRTRRLIDLETHRDVFGWVLSLLANRGLLKGKRIAIDATTLEANAAMRSIVRRDTGFSSFPPGNRLRHWA